eukprot:COSAG01_NODE_408_length_17382_cov_6.231431_8_plen_122_part_00
MALRSDIPLALSEHIQKIRADPELHCPNFCKKLVVDPAGEWHRTNKFFMHQMVKLGAELDDEGFFVEIDSDKTVDVNNPPLPPPPQISPPHRGGGWAAGLFINGKSPSDRNTLHVCNLCAQ